MSVVEIKDVLVENGFKVTEEVEGKYGIVDKIFLEKGGLLVALETGVYDSGFKTVVKAEYAENFKRWGLAYEEWKVSDISDFHYSIIFNLLGMIYAKEKNLPAYKKALE